MTDDLTAADRRTNKFRLIIAVVAAVLSVLVPIAIVPLAILSFGGTNDLPEYYASASLAVTGKGKAIYDLSALGMEEQRIFPSIGGRVIGFFIPPFSLPLLLPVVLMPTGLAPILWAIVLASAVVASLFVLRKTFKLSLVATLWLCAVVCLSGPLFEALRIGQLAPILLLSFSISLYMMSKGKDVAAGLALILMLLKPQELLPIMLYLAGARKWKLVGVVVGATAVLGAIGTLFIGLDGWREYTALVSDPSVNATYMQPQLCATVRGQLLRLPGISPTVANFVSLATLALVSCGSVFAGWKLRGNVDGLLLVVVPLGLITALHCHNYDLMLLAPSVVALTRFPPAAKIPPVIALTALASSGVFMLPFYVMIYYQYILKGGVINPHFIALLIWSIVLAVFAWKHLRLLAVHPESST